MDGRVLSGKKKTNTRGQATSPLQEVLYDIGKEHVDDKKIAHTKNGKE